MPQPCAPRPRRARRAALVTGPLAALVGLAGLTAATPAVASNPAGPHDPLGAVTATTAGATPASVHFAGWAADPDAPTANATIVSLVDGRIVGRTATAIARPAVSRHHGLGPTPGFAVDVPVPATGTHTACVAAANTGQGIARVLGCTTTPLGSTDPDPAAHDPLVTVEHAVAGPGTITVSGWTRDPDYRMARSVVVLYVDGNPVSTIDSVRADAAQVAAGAAPRGAFSITVPATTAAHLACVWVVNVGPGANSSPGCTALQVGAPAGGAPVTTVPRPNRVATRQALSHVGGRYVWGAEGPKVFDCSGLVMFSYARAGVATPRIAADQFAAAHLIPASRAVRGDLVFYHDGIGAVYHVGIYLSPGRSVAAIDTADGIDYQPITDPTATYGSFTHS